jgi:hypothetical protein
MRFVFLTFGFWASQNLVLQYRTQGSTEMGRGRDIDRQTTLVGTGERWSTNDSGGADNAPHWSGKPPMPPMYQNLITSENIDEEDDNMTNTSTQKIARKT